MGEYKAKAIQTNLGTFRHNQTYPGIIQAYSGIFRNLCYPNIFCNCGIFSNLLYSEPEAYSESWYIQKPAMLRTLAYSEFEAHSEPSHIYDEALIIFTVIIIFTNYNYFCKACHFEMNILRCFLQR